MPKAVLPLIHIIGPRDRGAYPGVTVVNTTSHAVGAWNYLLSPFALGPVPLYDGRSSQTMENAWQYAKVYAQHVASNGAIASAYWDWAQSGWNNPKAVCYPMGKGAKPEFLLWGEARLGYIEARQQVYFRLYRDAVRQTEAWQRLRALAAGQALALWDFDG